VILSEIPQAAGIASVLCAAGMDSADVHAWFHRRRKELAWSSPAVALMTPGRGPGRLVLAVARADAVELRETGQIATRYDWGDVAWCVVADEPKHAWEGSE
jgi:hypothetical protein